MTERWPFHPPRPIVYTRWVRAWWDGDSIIGFDLRLAHARRWFLRLRVGHLSVSVDPISADKWTVYPNRSWLPLGRYFPPNEVGHD